jgi:hypothetical protein
MIKRIVSTGFWTDDKVLDMPPDEKLFMLYLITNPHSAQLGIYKINEKQMAFEIGYSTEKVIELLSKFENEYKIIAYCKETKEVAILNYLKHSILSGGRPVADLLTKEINNVKNKELISIVFENLKGYENLNETCKQIISNHNHNHKSFHELGSKSDVETVTTRKKQSVKLTKADSYKSYGELSNVELTEDEHKKLKEQSLLDYIDRLSVYLSSTGKTYKSHYATILTWARKDGHGKSKQFDKRWGEII